MPLGRRGQCSFKRAHGRARPCPPHSAVVPHAALTSDIKYGCHILFHGFPCTTSTHSTLMTAPPGPAQHLACGTRRWAPGQLDCSPPRQQVLTGQGGGRVHPREGPVLTRESRNRPSQQATLIFPRSGQLCCGSPNPDVNPKLRQREGELFNQCSSLGLSVTPRQLFRKPRSCVQAHSLG